VDDRRIEIEEFELPKIGPDAGLLQVEACGMCGSDVEQYDGAFGQLSLRYPVIPVHEPVAQRTPRISARSLAEAFLSRDGTRK
jgi:D-arabinose 1-dehydrogenase-like Zn-dependent alcohol dehydrogenase